MGAEYVGVTMLLTVGAMNFETLVVGVSRSNLSAGGTTIVGQRCSVDWHV